MTKTDHPSRPKPETFEESKSFCTRCPSVDEVTRALQTLDFRLTFQMGESAFPSPLHVPALPAQYHYRDQHNTEVIYLAGYDAETNRTPLHASRFWIYSGANVAAYLQVRQFMAAQWSLIWEPIRSLKTLHKSRVASR